ncbi:MAG: hypothetical protein F6Q13_06085 [Mycobacterium sp.]|nr:MAG: hypothetical protein F6Q13_06085 [Mycobacterium sp.]
MDVGYLGDRFVPKPLDEIMPVIQDAYITHYRDTGGWVFSYWLNLTDKGRQVALSTEEGRRVAEHEKRRRASLRRQR